jgi:hypothetical protein
VRTAVLKTKGGPLGAKQTTFPARRVANLDKSLSSNNFNAARKEMVPMNRKLDPRKWRAESVG